MAPISKTITWAALVAIVSGRPFLGARQQAPEMVTETDWVTVDVPVTLWVDQNGTPLSTVAQGGNFAAMQTTSTTSVAPVASSASASASVSSAAPTVTSTTSVASVPSMEPVQPPAPSSSPVSTSSSVPTTTYAPPTTYVPTTLIATTSSQYQQGRQATTSVAAAASSPAAAAGGSTNSGAISASTTNTCEGTGAACVGDITYYSGGLGACGWNVDTNSAMQIALPYEFMGTESNDNPYCGRSLTIQNPTTGKTVSATVGDKCMGCTGRSIDLTEVLFTAIGNGCDGRCSGFEWWFD